jgi:hypothetical protein
MRIWRLFYGFLKGFVIFSLFFLDYFELLFL